MEQLEPIKVIGEGAFGKVYLMRHKQERTLQCVKVIKIKNIPKKEREACRAEVQLMKRLRHPNIVAYRDSFLAKNRESLCIVMTYCDGGDLGNQIDQAKKRRRPFGEAKVLHWFVQMALGLHYMHASRVLHRDLKTQNIFLLGNGRLVLGDLGISKVLEGTLDFAQTCIGTPYYMSPEIFKNKPYNHKSDIWALGCVLYECATLNHAFDASSLNGLACKIVKGRYPPVPSRYSKHLSDLVGAMLATSPSQRPTLEAILRRPFVRKHVRGFFADLARRPSQSIGAGTRAVRAAAVCVADHKTASSPDVDALRAQLEDLRMGDVIAQALNPEDTDDDPRKAQRRARERTDQLRREEDRKGAVEQALLRLRKEREARLRDRKRLREEARRRAARKPRVPRQVNRQREWKRPVPRSRVRASEPDARRANLVAPERASHDQRRRNMRDDEARRVRELERWENEQERAAAERKRRVEAARPPDRQRDARPPDANGARRDRAREAERQRQREIIEKLKADKLELDEAEARRQTRARQAERRRAEAALLQEREAAAERRHAEAELLRDQERRLAARLEAAKRPASPRASPRVAEAKNRDDGALAAKHAFSPRNDGLNARDRVLMRKRAAQETRERELNRALAEARQEQAQQAQQAKAWGDAQYRSSMDSKLPRRPPATPPWSPEAKAASPQCWASPSPRRPPLTPDTPPRCPPTVDDVDTPPRCPPTRDDDDIDLVLDDSESEDEEAAIGFAMAAPEHIEHAEQDIQKREDELKAELDLTTQRCEELRRSLVDTKARMAARDAAPPVDEESESEDDAAGVLNAVVEEDESDDDGSPPRPTSRLATPPQASPPRVLESPRTPHLADAPSPSGRLAQRVHLLKERCVRAIGPDQFRAVYDYLKKVQDADDEDLDYDVDDAGLEVGGDAYDAQADAETQARLLAILGPDKVHLAPLLDQLLFMEEAL